MPKSQVIKALSKIGPGAIEIGTLLIYVGLKIFFIFKDNFSL